MPAWSEAQGNDIIRRHAGREGALLPILHDIQAAFGHVPAQAVPLIAEALNLTRAEVHGVVSFYHDFRDKPAGRHVLKLCRAEACQSVNGERLGQAVPRSLRRGVGRHDAGRPSHHRGDVLPGPLRLGAVGDARRRGDRAADARTRSTTSRARSGDGDAHLRSARCRGPRRRRRQGRRGDRRRDQTQGPRRRDRAHRLARPVLAGAADRGRDCRAAASASVRWR